MNRTALRLSHALCLCLCLCLLAGAPGCSRSHPGRPAAAVGPGRLPEVTGAAGIRFSLGHRGRHPLTLLETAGCGGAFVDYDQDGWPDILLVGQTTRAPEPACALYRNRRDGSFEDVTRVAGLDLPGTWMGCAVGDYDNDGFPDLVLTGYGGLALLHNEPSGVRREARRFKPVTAAMGLRSGPTDWFTSAGWADVDHNGFLDLYVARYVQFDARAPQFCNLGLDPKGRRVTGTCGPEIYTAQKGVFYLNRAEQGFEEATARFGLEAAHGKGLGVAFGDFNGDGWPDLYAANDRMPGDLFENRAGRRFAAVGAEMGTGYSGDGRPQAGMGVDWGDFDRDGRMDLIVTTFALERKSLYHNEGAAGFREMSDEVGLSAAIPYVAWGTRWFDADNDGRLDWVAANGHALDNMGQVDPAQPYAQPTQLFHQERGLFREIGASACPALARPIAGRGVAVGDYDDDGRADLLITNGEGAPLLLHNESAGGNHWLRVALAGSRGNRDAIGARVWLTTADGTQVRDVTTGGSYLSAADPRLLFGLGRANRVTKLRVRWPAGATATRVDLPVDREVTLTEP
jgi:hypothetical protein